MADEPGKRFLAQLKLDGVWDNMSPTHRRGAVVVGGIAAVFLLIALITGGDETVTSRVRETVRRSVITDGQGQYQIIELRPGRYDVKFTLPGFSSLTREGVELTSSFTATINAELKVGDVSETLTVSGSTPLVDVTKVTQQKVITTEELNAAINIAPHPTAESAG